MTDTDPDLLSRPERRAPIERDHMGRPLIVPPDKDRPVAYTRCTTFIKCLDDTSLLERWGKRMVLVGAALDPSIPSRAAWEFDRDALDGLAEQALEAAKAHEKRDKGTRLHLLSEHVDRGEPLPDSVTIGKRVHVTTDQDRADMDAYRAATEPLRVTHIECFTTLDDLRVAGTPDRLVEVNGRTYIADLKTGRVDLGALAIAMQLAVYSRSVFYDHVTREREPLPDVDQDRAIVMHLPSGSGRCELHWVDIATGWEHVLLAREVRKARNLKQQHVFQPFGVFDRSQGPGAARDERWETAS